MDGRVLLEATQPRRERDERERARARAAREGRPPPPAPRPALAGCAEARTPALFPPSAGASLCVLGKTDSCCQKKSSSQCRGPPPPPPPTITVAPPPPPPPPPPRPTLPARPGGHATPTTLPSIRASGTGPHPVGESVGTGASPAAAASSASTHPCPRGTSSRTRARGTADGDAAPAGMAAVDTQSPCRATRRAVTTAPGSSGDLFFVCGGGGE